VLQSGAAGAKVNAINISASGVPTDSSGYDLRPMGVGQTWQNLSGSRNSGTPYTNNTNRPIMVSAYYQTNQSSFPNTGISLVTVVGGVTIMNSYFYTPNDSLTASAVFVVPPGATYSITSSTVAGGSGLTFVWNELR